MLKQKKNPGGATGANLEKLSEKELTTSILLENILDCAGRGWHVFPLYPRGKRPRVEVWQELSSNEPESITSWWTQNPNDNVVIDTGKSGLVIVDEDTPGALDTLASEHGESFPPTYTVTTSRGRHLYYAAPKGDPIGCPQKFKQYGIDIRGKGGYVVGPGSVHESGATYTADRAEVTPLPQWFANALRAPRVGKTSPAPTMVTRADQDGTSAYVNAAINGE